jgi:hypothetical protein
VGKIRERGVVFLVVGEDEEILGLWILEHMDAIAIAELKATIRSQKKKPLGNLGGKG